MTSPIRKHIATFAGYRLHDIVKGTSILKTLHFLRKSQYWPEEKMQEYRSEKLKKLVSYAYEKVPYYHDLFNSEHLKPSDIRSIDDIWKIPILTKEQARKANKAMLSKDLSSMRVKRGKTGGTTGPPLTIYSGTQARSFVWGAFLRWYDWMDIHPGNYTVTFWGTPTVMSINHIKRIKQKSAYWLLNNKIENAFNLNEKTIPALIANINHRKPSFVRGYLSAMLQIGNFAETNNIPLFAPKAISTTTETLLPHLRERLNSTWGAPLFDQYGCGECESIAFECDAHEGLHINEEHVIIEAVDDNGITGQNKGHAIITDLDNYAMPFIRYQNNDDIEFAQHICSCGRNAPLLNNVLGRKADVIQLKDGSKVHGVFFTNLFYEIDSGVSSKLQRFQIFQSNDNTVEIRIEKTTALDSSFIENLNEVLPRFFNAFEVKIMDELPSDSSGKFRYVIKEKKTDVK